MKQCPVCKRTFDDDLLNFCLEDGELLVGLSTDFPPKGISEDAPPTIVMDSPRITNPYQAPAPLAHQWQQPGPPYAALVSLDDTMAKASLVLGVASVLLICCYGGLWLGIPAIVVGFIGWRRSQEDPSRFGGSGLSAAGIALGAVSLSATLLVLLLLMIG